MTTEDQINIPITVNLKVSLVEISKINLGPGDVLSAKLVGDVFSDSDIHSFQAVLQNRFPNNQILVTVFPSDNDMKFEVLSQEVPEPVVSYCSNCSCGKKDKIEGENV